MRRFDYGFLDNGLLPAKMVDLTSSIYSLRTAAGVRKSEYKKVFTELETCNINVFFICIKRLLSYCIEFVVFWENNT